MTKKSYTKPNLILFGDVKSLTKGSADGDFTDAAFPVKTPKSELTFS